MIRFNKLFLWTKHAKSERIKMNDFIATVRETQLKLAREITSSLTGELLVNGRQKLMLDELSRKDGVTKELVDRDALRIIAQKQVERDVLVALHGYTDWLVTELWRNRRVIFETNPLFIPPCLPRHLKQIE